LNIFQVDTSLGLLGRVRMGDEQAWTDLSVRCSKLLAQWAQWQGLQSADAEDLTQEALLVVLARIRRFRHRGRGSLRAWLRAIAWRCLCRARARSDRAATAELLEHYRRTESEISEIEQQFDDLQRLEVLQECMLAVQQRVRAQTWEAFRLLVLDAVPGPIAADRLNMQVQAVYAAKKRVQTLITTALNRRRMNLPADN